jgi:mersacidin/lichenicidin family type 2 lantibiotic
MSESDIVRAWKDEQYRNSLSADQQAEVPVNPAGEVELDDDELKEVDGASSNPALTAGCCQQTVNTDTCQIGWCIGSAFFTPATTVCISVQSC